MARRRNPSKAYRRTDRLNELLREIIAEELGRIDDEDLALVTITGVTVDDELTVATVYFSALVTEGDALVDGEALAEAGADDAAVAARLDSHRVRLQDAINRQTRLRRTPILSFRPDSGVREGARIEEILRQIDEDRVENPDV
ncbi:MAG: ribosome-binding factor A [Acidimicrobiales bacterium]